eukprot:5239754-Ditylum_brightwellii.AAC.1
MDLNIPYVQLSVALLSKQLTKARKNLQQVQKDAAEIQDEMLEEMAGHQTTHNNSDIVTIIKNICHREK